DAGGGAPRGRARGRPRRARGVGRDLAGHGARVRRDRGRLRLGRRADALGAVAARLAGGRVTALGAPSRPLEGRRGAVHALQEEVRELARARDAVILAHNYQVPEVQDVADYVGDSLGLSRQAAATDAGTIVF